MKNSSIPFFMFQLIRQPFLCLYQVSFFCVCCTWCTSTHADISRWYRVIRSTRVQRPRLHWWSPSSVRRFPFDQQSTWAMTGIQESTVALPYTIEDVTAIVRITFFLWTYWEMYKSIYKIIRVSYHFPFFFFFF